MAHFALLVYASQNTDASGASANMTQQHGFVMHVPEGDRSEYLGDILASAAFKIGFCGCKM